MTPKTIFGLKHATIESFGGKSAYLFMLFNRYELQDNTTFAIVVSEFCHKPVRKFSIYRVSINVYRVLRKFEDTIQKETEGLIVFSYQYTPAIFRNKLTKFSCFLTIATGKKWTTG